MTGVPEPIGCRHVNTVSQTLDNQWSMTPLLSLFRLPRSPVTVRGTSWPASWRTRPDWWRWTWAGTSACSTHPASSRSRIRSCFSRIDSPPWLAPSRATKTCPAPGCSSSPPRPWDPCWGPTEGTRRPTGPGPGIRVSSVPAWLEESLSSRPSGRWKRNFRLRCRRHHRHCTCPTRHWGASRGTRTSTRPAGRPATSGGVGRSRPFREDRVGSRGKCRGSRTRRRWTPGRGSATWSSAAAAPRRGSRACRRPCCRSRSPAARSDACRGSRRCRSCPPHRSTWPDWCRRWSSGPAGSFWWIPRWGTRTEWCPRKPRSASVDSGGRYRNSRWQTSSAAARRKKEREWIY